MAKANYNYTMPKVTGDDMGFNFAEFLYANTGSIFGKWTGNIKVADQKKLAGRDFAGKQRIHLNGDTEHIAVTRTVCFGTDFETTVDTCWAKFEQGEVF